jgi:hypothetical protein
MTPPGPQCLNGSIMSRPNRSNGVDRHARSGTPTALPSPAVPASAPAVPLYGLDALRTVLDASWSAWSRVVAAAEDLHRLQCVALDTAAAALSTAVSDAERARDVQDLFKVQVQWAGTTVEQWAALHREWLDRLTAMASDLAASPAAAGTARPSSRPASAGSGSDGSTVWPAELLMNAQTAWSQWAQQLANTVNRGVMPS